MQWTLLILTKSLCFSQNLIHLISLFCFHRFLQCLIIRIRCANHCTYFQISMEIEKKVFTSKTMLNIFTDRKSVYLLVPFNQIDLMLLVLLFLEKLFLSVENLPSWHKDVVKTSYKRLNFGLKNILDWSEMEVAKTIFLTKKNIIFSVKSKNQLETIYGLLCIF